MRSVRVLALVVVALTAACSASGPSAPNAGKAPSATPTPTGVPAPSSSSPVPSAAASPAPSAGGIRPTDVTFVTPRRGWVVDRGRLEMTTDGGRTWSALPPAPAPVTRLRFATDLVGYAWTAEGPLWVTHDGGRSWHDGQLAMVAQVETSAGTVWALAGPSPYPGVWRATVGTEQFVKLGTTPNRSGTLDVHGTTAYVVGDTGAGPIAGSLDVRRGSAVRNTPLPCRGPDVYVPFAPLGVSTDGAVLLVCNPAPGRGQLHAFLSRDQTRTWVTVPPPPEPPADVTATRSRLFAWGRDLHAADSGRWSTALPGPANGDGFTLVGFQDDQHGVALGRDGVLHLTTDGGRTWTTARL